MRAINFLCLEDSLLCNMPNKIPLHNPAMTSMSATRFVVGGMFMISSKMKIEEKKAITETNAKFPYCFLRTSEISASPDNSSILINRLSSVFSFSSPSNLPLPRFAVYLVCDRCLQQEMHSIHGCKVNTHEHKQCCPRGISMGHIERYPR